MDEYIGTNELYCCKIKSARQKKRLVKKDFHKQLIRLHRKRNQLIEIKRNMPLLPIKNPYQQGWVRTFEMSEEMVESKHAIFFQTLLSKINTVQYSRVKNFSKKRRKNRKKIWVETPQSLFDFNVWQWERNERAFTEKEKQLFHPQEYWCSITKKIKVRFVFTEPWRFVLRIRPNIITHQKMMDEVLEQEIGEIDQHIDSQFLQFQINKIVYGRSYQLRRRSKEEGKHKHNYLNEWLQE